MNSSVLNIDQSSERLSEIHGEMDYYWYLRSPQFRSAFFRPMGELIDDLIGYEGVMLDVACGEGCLFDHVHCKYVGFDGSEPAIEKGKRDRPGAELLVGRMESPPLLPHTQFDLVLIGGVLSVLVKPEARYGFIESYVAKYRPQFVVLYDLSTLDVSFMDTARFSPVIQQHASAVDIDIEDVKKHRSWWAYEVLY